MLYNSFQSTIVTQKSAASLGGIYTQIINVPSLEHPTQHPKLHIDCFSRFCTAHSRECLYIFTVCVKTRLTRD